jgi:hypothetical protein
VSGSRYRRRCRRRSGTGRSSTSGSRTNNRYGRGGCFLAAVGLFFVSDDKRGPRYRGNSHVSRTCNDYLVTDFREILRIDPGTKIDSRCGENIRDTTIIPAQVHTNDTALCASFLSKICNLKEAIVRDRDCQRRSRDDFAPGSTRKNKSSIYEKEGNKPPAEMDFDRHMRGHRMSKLDSNVVTSMVGVCGPQLTLHTSRLGKSV